MSECNEMYFLTYTCYQCNNIYHKMECHLILHKYYDKNSIKQPFQFSWIIYSLAIFSYWIKSYSYALKVKQNIKNKPYQHLYKTLHKWISIISSKITSMLSILYKDSLDLGVARTRQNTLESNYCVQTLFS